jgi:hypothetical protein
MDGNEPSSGIQRIVSGGQTGVDRGALDAALQLGIEHGGWCPRGRVAEDGRIPPRYQLTETEASEYWVRTERNVIDSDGTLLLYQARMKGGTEFTYRMTRKHRKPSLQVDFLAEPCPETVRQWILENDLRVLNVAGPRESSCPGIAEQARHFLLAVFT